MHLSALQLQNKFPRKVEGFDKLLSDTSVTVLGIYQSQIGIGVCVGDLSPTQIGQYSNTEVFTFLRIGYLVVDC